jgi:hypothetical protein
MIMCLTNNPLNNKYISNRLLIWYKMFYMDIMEQFLLMVKRAAERRIQC